MKKTRKIRYDGREYNRRKLQVYESYYPTTYPCKTCGSPVVDGFACRYCDDCDPRNRENE